MADPFAVPISIKTEYVNPTEKSSQGQISQYASQISYSNPLRISYQPPQTSQTYQPPQTYQQTSQTSQPSQTYQPPQTTFYQQPPQFPPNYYQASQQPVYQSQQPTTHVNSCFPAGDMQINGVVSWVKPIPKTQYNDKKKTTEPLIFKMISLTTNKVYIFYYHDGNYPLHEGDVVHAICERYMGQQSFGAHFPNFFIKRPPFVQIPTGRDSLVKLFIREGRLGDIKGNRLYNYLVDTARAELAQNSNDPDNPSPIREPQMLSQDGGAEISLYLSKVSEDYKSTGKVPPIDTNVITEEEWRKLLIFWIHKRNLRRLRLLGLDDEEINNSKMRFDDLYERVIDNPFTVGSISIEKCKEILKRQNRSDPDNTMITLGMIFRRIWDNTQKRAWVCTPIYHLRSDFPNYHQLKDRLYKEFDIIEESDHIYLQEEYRVETRMFEFLTHLSKENKIVDDDPFDTPMESGETRQSAHFTSSGGVTLTTEQQAAVQGALDHPLSVINGPPGSGKTTVCKKIIENLKLRNLKYVCTSFTGKAVSRFRQATGEKGAKTLHRMIANSHRDVKEEFDYLIIDETSMVRTEDLLAFLEAHGILSEKGPPLKKIRVVLIGDEYQLQPIGAGSLFKQLISSYTVYKYSLTENHRVVKIGEADGIILNLQNIRNYVEGMAFNFTPAANFVLFDTDRLENVFEIIRGLYSGMDPNGKKSITIEDFIVICPYNEPLEEINRGVQIIFHDGKPDYLDKMKTPWRLGDKVVMRINNYDLDIYNGEEGIVTEIYPEVLVAHFGEQGAHPFPLTWTYDRNNFIEEGHVQHGLKSYEQLMSGDDNETLRNQDTRQLRRAYGSTVHRSQGSEWSIVIVYIPYGKKISRFLCRDLIYTALSRAKNLVIVCGNIALAEQSVITKAAIRYELLGKKLASALPKIDQIRIDRGIQEMLGKGASSYIFDDDDF